MSDVAYFNQAFHSFALIILQPPMRFQKLLTALCLLLLGYTASAQEVGVRFGDVVGNTVALDMRFNNVHADVSFGDGLGVEVLWDVIYKPLGGEAFNWYLGVGPSALIDDPFWLGGSAEVGLEYHFNGVPIAIGADWRPTLWLIEETDFNAGGFGFNARFCFGGK